MTFATFETSVEAGQPVEVYRFTIGAQVYFYTSSESEETVGVNAYDPVAISRNKTSAGTTERNADFEITLPTSDPVARFFLGTMPGNRVRVEVEKFHRADTPTPQVVKVFDGYVYTSRLAKLGKETILVAREPLGDVHTIPRRTYHAQCNFFLYDPLTCKVDSTLSTFRAANKTVLSQVGAVLTVDGLTPTYVDGWFDAGFVEVVGGSDFRPIQSHVGNALTLFIPFKSMPTTVNVFAGCKHDIATCKAKFDNVINFGGFAFVPKTNPFEDGIV